MYRRPAPVAAVVWLFVAGSSGAAAGPLTYSGSLQYATGRYTLEDRTHSVYLFNGLRWAAGRWGLQVNLPLVLQSPSETAAPRASTAGVGDAFLRVDRQIVDLRGRLPSIRLSAELKAPLSRMHASFGTGEWDVGGGVSLADRIGPGFMSSSTRPTGSSGTRPGSICATRWPTAWGQGGLSPAWAFSPR